MAKILGYDLETWGIIYHRLSIMLECAFKIWTALTFCVYRSHIIWRKKAFVWRNKSKTLCYGYESVILLFVSKNRLFVWTLVILSLICNQRFCYLAVRKWSEEPRTELVFAMLTKNDISVRWCGGGFLSQSCMNVAKYCFMKIKKSI